MKKLLILLILFINFAFTDEVHYTIKSFGSKTQRVIKNIEILEIRNGRLIYTDNYKEKNISCSSINFIKLIDKESEINFEPNCLLSKTIKRVDMLNINTPLYNGKSTNNIENIKKTSLVKAGSYLKEFTKNYYIGFSINIAGTVINYIGIINNDSGMIKTGAGGMLLGSLVCLASFSKVSQAGDYFIEASEEIKLKEKAHSN